MMIRNSFPFSMNKTSSFYDDQFYMYSRTNSVVIRKTLGALPARYRLEPIPIVIKKAPLKRIKKPFQFEERLMVNCRAFHSYRSRPIPCAGLAPSPKKIHIYRILLAGCWVSLGLSLHQLGIREYPFKDESYPNRMINVNVYLLLLLKRTNKFFPYFS
jgi:hypothetical protein